MQEKRKRTGLDGVPDCPGSAAQRASPGERMERTGGQVTATAASGELNGRSDAEGALCPKPAFSRLRYVGCRLITSVRGAWRALSSRLARRCIGPTCRAAWFGQPSDRFSFGNDLWPANPVSLSPGIPLAHWLRFSGATVTGQNLRPAAT